MLDKNTPIDQLIYTAGGSKKGKLNNADFGTYSTSKGIDSATQAEIETKLRIILKGDKTEFAPKYAYKRVLKPEATPHGLFTKKYKDSDYETIQILTASQIDILSETKDGDLRNALEDYNADYRDNPQSAPYRIASTKLADGRLIIVQQRAVNKVYSSADTRSGNYFSHVLIFPKGTELKDIDLNDLKFRNGLEKTEWGKEGIPAPEYLPTTSIVDMNNQSEQQTPKEDFSLEELLNIYKKTLLSNKDYKSRIEAKKIFNTEIVKGTNLLQLKCAMKTIFINQLKSGLSINDIEEDIINDLDLVETPYIKLLYSLELLVELQKKLDDAYERDSSEEASKLETDIDNLNANIQSYFNDCNKEELKEVIEYQKKYLQLSAEFDSLAKGTTLEKQNGSYMLKNSYKAVSKLEMKLNKANKNKQR